MALGEDRLRQVTERAVILSRGSTLRPLARLPELNREERQYIENELRMGLAAGTIWPLVVAGFSRLRAQQRQRGQVP